MITLHTASQKTHPVVVDETNYLALKKAVWIDIASPSSEEILWLESALGLMIPTRAAMQEIELSSRLYAIEDVLYMTITLSEGAFAEDPHDNSVTFILTNKQLLTLRYVNPPAFLAFTKTLKQLPDKNFECSMLLIYILEAVIDRSADVLEMVVYNLERLSSNIFHHAYVKNTAPSIDYTALIQEIGQNAEASGEERETLLTLNRLISFFNQTAQARLDQQHLLRLQTMTQDVLSLSDYSHFITGKVNFLLDATLGMVNIEQNNIIKIFSIAAVIFLPPTLIASIYGMNFHNMPELDWEYGYLVTLSLMIASAIMPYRFFKARKWL